MAFSKFNRCDLKFEKKIGEGSYSTVYQAKWKDTTYVAVKKLYKVQEDELEIMAQLQHENIVNLLGVVDEEPDFYLILELCSGGSLRDYLNTYEFKRLPKDQFYEWAKQAAKPIEYLKKHGIVHKDIKSANYVITSDNILKLTDFGLSKKIEQTMSNATARGTYGFMTPELMKSVILSTSYDIFSYGVVVWELWTTDVPFKGEPFYVIIWKVCNNNEHPAIPLDCPEPIATLMRQCWQADWKIRPDIGQVLTMINEAEASAADMTTPKTQEHNNLRSQEQKTGEEDHSSKPDVESSNEIGTIQGNGLLGFAKEILTNGHNAAGTQHDSLDEAGIPIEETKEGVLTNGLPGIEETMGSVTITSNPSGVDKPTAGNQSPILHGSWEFERKIGETGPGKLRGPRGIATTCSGDFAVAHKLSQRFVCVFSSTGDVKFNLDTKIDTGMFNPEPWDVVISTDGVYYITDRTPYVKMFCSTNGSYKGKWVAMSPPSNFTSELAQDDWVTVSPAESLDCGIKQGLESHLIQGMLKGLAINNKDQLYIGDIKHKYISKHNKDGKHIMSFRVSTTPRSLAVTSQETIVVSDWFETKSVLLLNTSGQSLHVIKPPAILPQDWIPQGITCHQDVICVCNFANTKVYCFSHHGEYLGSMPIETPQYPRCLAFSPDGDKLFVVFGHNPLPPHGIAVYKLQ